VDRRDPRPLGLACGVALAELEQPPAHARLELARRLLGERDREDATGRDAGPHVAGEALDEHRRLAAAGRRAEDEVAGVVADRPGLLVGELSSLFGDHASSQRQIVG
jgi:hypothetical protein